MARQFEGRSSANYATGPAPDQILSRLFCALCLHLVQPESTSIVHPLPHWNACNRKGLTQSSPWEEPWLNRAHSQLDFESSIHQTTIRCRQITTKTIKYCH